MGKRICALRMGFLPYLLPTIRQFLQILIERGHEVTLVKSYARGQSMAEEARPEMHNVVFDIVARRLPKSHFGEPLVFLESVVRSIVYGARSRPDIVIAFDVDTLLQGYIISRLCRAKLVFYAIELYAERPRLPGARFWMWLEKRLVNKAHLVVACEPNRARVMHDKYGARPVPMSVLNVVRYAAPRRTDALQRWLRGQGVEAKKIAYYGGAIAPSRCSDTFFEAARMLQEGIVIVLLGYVIEGYDPVAKIRECGVADRVFVHPPVMPSEIMEYAYSADLGLQPQLNEGLNSYYSAPIKLFQYLMAGLPVVAANFPGLIDIVEGNDVGMCVDPANPEAVAHAINTILGDNSVRGRMAANAERVAREKYCLEIEGKNLVDAIERL